MRKETKAQIVEIIRKNGQSTPHELAEKLNISLQALHRHLKVLTEESELEKIGSPPRVYYILKPQLNILQNLELNLNEEQESFFKDNFLYITPQGNILNGVTGFVAWARATNQTKDILGLTKEYIETKNTWNKFFDPKIHLINASEKFKTTFNNIDLENIFYLDFYSLPKFGKTKLGNLVLYAKQAQDKKQIKQIASYCKEPLIKLIQKEKIDAVVWVPHSLPRKVSFLKELKKNLKLSLPEITFFKAYSGEFLFRKNPFPSLQKELKMHRQQFFQKKIIWIIKGFWLLMMPLNLRLLYMLSPKNLND